LLHTTIVVVDTKVASGHKNDTTAVRAYYEGTTRIYYANCSIPRSRVVQKLVSLNRISLKATAQS